MDGGSAQEREIQSRQSDTAFGSTSSHAHDGFPPRTTQRTEMCSASSSCASRLMSATMQMHIVHIGNASAGCPRRKRTQLQVNFTPRHTPVYLSRLQNAHLWLQWPSASWLRCAARRGPSSAAGQWRGGPCCRLEEGVGKKGRGGQMRKKGRKEGNMTLKRHSYPPLPHSPWASHP